MRIAVAGLVHETNTYCRDETPASAFHQVRGERILRARGTQTSLGGAIETCEALGIEVVPLLAVSAQPSGIVAREAYELFKQEILDGLSREMPLDGVFLDMHGAGVVSGISDLEGDLAGAVRSLVGEAVPITATFDLHGNITQAMVNALDGTFACHEYPHVDLHERAAEAIALIKRMREENLMPVSHVESLPMLMPTTTTFEGIGKETKARILAEEAAQDEVIDISWFHGFPYTDTEHVGVHIVVTTTGNRELAESTAKRIAAELWSAREAFRPRSLSAEQAVAQAMASKVHPVVINETSDNCGGGTPGDGTHLLRAMLDARLEGACFGFIVDAQVAQQAHTAGVGAVINVSLGGKYDDLHGEPLMLSAYVKALHDGRLVMREMFRGAKLNLGKMARLVVDGIDIIVAPNRSQTFDIAPFIALGIDVMDYDIVALKSSNHFRAGFTDIAGCIITADPPGLTTHHVEIFPREHSPGPLWPIDDSVSYG